MGQVSHPDEMIVSVSNIEFVTLNRQAFGFEKFGLTEGTVGPTGMAIAD